MKAICEDLRAEYDELDRLVAGLDAKAWAMPTPFHGWTLFDQIAHICWADMAGVKALELPRKQFAAYAKTTITALMTGASMPAWANPEVGATNPQHLLSLWRGTRNHLLDHLTALEPKARLPWFGPDMGTQSFATARLMETWAHGQDVFDTLKIRRENTDRLRHIAHMGVTTFAWTFKNRGQPVPDTAMRIELTSPAGEHWRWGHEDAGESVEGSAEDFCLVVTQRRNIADTALETRGETARQWLSMAQCFAGPPADPPGPGCRAVRYDDVSRHAH